MFNINYNMVELCERRYVSLAKVGRRKVDKPKEKLLGVRLTAEDHEELRKRAEEHGLTITQAVLEGLKLLYKSWEN